jgi:hypothetical protein
VTGMDDRLAALLEARKLVVELYEVKNDRGYPRFSGGVGDVLTQELRIAEFLLRPGADECECGECQK